MTRVRFTPLCPSSTDGASCFLLEVGECRILLDCGWTEPYAVGDLTPLKEVAPSVDVVLLSHADPTHVAALPYAVAHFGLKATLLCTLPVSKMGQMFLYDTVISHQATEQFDQLSLDEVDVAFSQLIPLKYNQEFCIKEHGLVISARNSGRSVGGAAWLVSKDVYSFVYAIDYSHQRDKQAIHCQVVHLSLLNGAMCVVGIRHLNGFHFEAFENPSLFITDSKYIHHTETDQDKRNATLLWTALQTVRNGGNVLIPTDTAARVLDLILLLEDYWVKNKLSYPLVFLCPVSFSTVSFASCQLEWMQASITDAFERDRDNPFDCRCLRFCNTQEDYERLGNEPRVVLASHASLETGFSRQLAIEWMEDEKNQILLTAPPKVGSLAALLMERVQSGSQEAIEVEISRRVPLVGEELEAYEAEKEKQRKAAEAEEMDQEMETEAKSEISSVSMGLEDGSAEKPSHDQPSTDTTPSRPSKITKQLSLEAEGKQSEVKHYYLQGVLIDGFQLTEGTLHPMFPFEEVEMGEWSVYGESFDATNLFPTLTSQEEQSLLNSAPVMMEEEVKDLPTKIVTEHRSLTLKAGVQLFDMIGNTHRHFIQHLIPYLQPRNLILVNGSAETHAELQSIAAAQCPQLRSSGRILSPQNGDSVELKDILNSFEVSVHKELANSVQWKHFNGSRLTWIQGALHQPDPAQERFQLEMAEGETEAVSASLYVSDGRLTRIKAALRGKQLETEFRDGALLCNKSIRIRVDAEQGVVVEGPISLDYYLVRKTIDDIFMIKK